MAGIYPGYNGFPDMTGNEVFLADVDPATLGSLPESVALTSKMVSGARPSAFKNAIVGGDFGANPWQRGTTSGTITNTLTYTADRFFALGGASSAIVVSRQTLTGAPGVSHAARVQRSAANADVAVINFGTALTTDMSRRFQGRQVVLSFFASRGANFSPTAALLGLRLIAGKGTDQSAANMVAGSWTTTADLQLATAAPGTVPVGSNAGGNPNTSIEARTVLTNVIGVPITTDRTRYQVTAFVPTDITQLGVLFTMTPVGTAGANDWFQIDSVQLEDVAPAFPFATPFEIRGWLTEQLLCQRFFWRLNEQATAAAVQANGMISATNVQTVAIPTPVPMRIAPTVTVSAGTFRFNIAGTLTAVGGGFAGGATATQSPSCINVVGAVTATVGQATQLVSGAATWGGFIDATAEL